MATVLTQTGRAIISGRMFGTSPSQVEAKFVGVGTGAGTAAVTDTTLFTEVGTRISGTSSQVTTTTTNDTWQLLATYTNISGGAQTITNTGDFDALTVGNLCVKGDLAAPATLQIGDAVAFTYQTKFQ